MKAPQSTAFWIRLEESEFRRMNDLPNVHPIWRKLEELRRLPPGWNYGIGEPPAESACCYIRELINTALGSGFTEFDLFPGDGGELMLTIYQDANYLEFLVVRDGEIEFSREELDKRMVDGETISLAKAIERINLLGKQICTSSDFLTSPSTTTGARNDFRVSRSEIVWYPVYQSSYVNAPVSPVGLCAST